MTRLDARIVELACFRVDIPAGDGGYGLSGGRVYSSFPSTIVRLTSDDGTVGWGEASTMGSTYLDGFVGSTQAALHELAPAVFAADPLEARALVRAMDATLVGHLPAKAAIDIAAWDLRARLLGVPVATLLGGIQQTAVPGFTGVPIGPLDGMVDEARAIVARGYRAWQIKVGDDPVVDAQRVRAIVEATPANRTYLSCDANRGWTSSQAIRFANLVGDLDLCLEQPCTTLDELIRVRRATGRAIVVDEIAKTASDLLAALASGVADGVNIKPVRVGGLTRAAQMRDIAEGAGLTITVDEPMGGRLASSSNAHLAATVAPELLQGASWFGEYDSPDEPPAFAHGTIALPPGPGLGVVPDESVVGEAIAVISR